jgi:iron complex outermembrane recepter protein
MNTVRQRILLLLTTTGLSVLMLSAGARAQTAGAHAAATTPDMSEVIVTAQKRSQRLLDVPMSITALSGDQLKLHGAVDIKGLANLTPGLTFVDSGFSVPVYSLRGVGFYDQSMGARPTVSIYVDEAPLPFSNMTEGAAFDLERVEVLKGPQGTLFGQNATGGAINFIAAKPQSAFGAGATASYGSYDTADIQGYVTGPIAPNLDARLALHTIQGDGWQKSYTRPDATNGAKDFDQGRLLFDWRPTDRLKVSLNLNGFIDRSDTQASQLIAVLPTVPAASAAIPALIAYPLAPHNDRAADWDPSQPLRKNNTFYQGVLQINYDLTSQLQLVSLTDYAKMDIHQNIDASGTDLPNANFYNRGSTSSISEELRLVGDMHPLHWIVGANYAHDTTYESDHIDSSYSTVAAINQTEDPLNNQTFDTTSVFANGDLDLFDSLVAHAGVRYTEADLSYSGCTRVGDPVTSVTVSGLINELRAGAGFAPVPVIGVGQCFSLNANLTPGMTSGSLDQNNVSWRVGLDWKPMHNTLLYVNISKGYKAGSAPTVGSFDNAEDAPVSQESVLAYEVGAKASAFDHMLDASAAAFYYDYSDKQVRGRIFTSVAAVFGPLEGLVNVPKSRVEGLEGQVDYHPIQGLTLSVGATYLDSEVIGTYLNYSVTGNQANFGGEAFPFTPKFQVVASGLYKIPVTEDLSAVLGVDVNYRSATTAGFGDEPILDINAYTLVDFQVGVETQNGKWNFTIFGNNVTDQYYWTDVNKFVDTVRRVTGEPAMYGIRLSYKY